MIETGSYWFPFESLHFERNLGSMISGWPSTKRDYTSIAERPNPMGSRPGFLAQAMLKRENCCERIDFTLEGISLDNSVTI